MSEQKFVPFWTSRIFWIAAVVISAFTLLIALGKLELDGAAVTAFFLAVFSGVVGLSRREKGDAGAPTAAPSLPPEMADALASFARSMTSQRGDAADEKPDDESEDEEEKEDEGS